MAKNESSLHQKSGASSTAKGTRRQPKHFLEQKEALELAASIASVQEGKALSRADKHRQPQPGNPHPDHKTQAKNSSKERIKEKKAVLVAQRARLKKAKAKQRKAYPSDDQDLTSSMTRNPIRKRVSFA
ncbi:hypothetical protein PILCRDRAFT_9952 [Piloderma croceum F 1598]|uniref:Uncharacterized protein n=1 Tax=Piloderma croceum (strain F 1598) TaxID=765440 RepID=A0A0C3FKU5_PILCF|nr:hypothetical protein PILCRDRAFT_9952 [Piloderma croceum F 1598]